MTDSKLIFLYRHLSPPTYRGFRAPSWAGPGEVFRLSSPDCGPDYRRKQAGVIEQKYHMPWNILKYELYKRILLKPPCKNKRFRLFPETLYASMNHLLGKVLTALAQLNLKVVSYRNTSSRDVW